MSIGIRRWRFHRQWCRLRGHPPKAWQYQTLNCFTFLLFIILSSQIFHLMHPNYGCKGPSFRKFIHLPPNFTAIYLPLFHLYHQQANSVTLRVSSFSGTRSMEHLSKAIMVRFKRIARLVTRSVMASFQLDICPMLVLILRA